MTFTVVLWATRVPTDDMLERELAAILASALDSSRYITGYRLERLGPVRRLGGRLKSRGPND